MTEYIRVKSKKTGHEFDLPKQSFDETRYTRVDKTRYPETTRPRRPKPSVKLGGTSPVKTAARAAEKE